MKFRKYPGIICILFLALCCVGLLILILPPNLRQQDPGTVYTIPDSSETLFIASPATETKKEPSTIEDTPSDSSTEFPEDLYTPSTESEEIPMAELLPGLTRNAELMISQRNAYADGFYCEPLSDPLKEYITGISYPATDAPLEISYDDLHYVHLLHYDFNGDVTEGELICNKSLSQDMLEIFYTLYENRYPIEKVHLIEDYMGDDNLSMADNNTSCFNYRVVEGTTSLSNHATGCAIDINPLYNPYITFNKDGSSKVSPVGGSEYEDRSKDFPYKIDKDDLCYRLFIQHGFAWGGVWRTSKDYQHFQKPLK